MKKLKNFLLITVPVILICLVVVEFILRKWFWVPNPYDRFKYRVYNPFVPSAFPPNMKLVCTSNEGLPGLEKQMAFTTNNLGFRGDSLIIPKPVNEFRIFLVGGSTAECLYIDDSKSLNTVLQKELNDRHGLKNVKVYNSGKSGDGSPEYMATLSQKIIHLQPDLVIVFAGINDLMRSVQNYDYAHLQPTIDTARRNTLYHLATQLQIARRIYYTFKPYEPEEQRQLLQLNSNYTRLVSDMQKVPVSDSMPLVNGSAFERNLRSITGICGTNNVQLVFMTNQSTWNSQVDSTAKKFHWALVKGKVRYSEQNMDRSLDSLNGVTRKVAASQMVPLFDLADSIPKSTQYFYDDCHFNVAGARFAGEKLAAFLAEEILLQRRQGAKK